MSSALMAQQPASSKSLTGCWSQSRPQNHRLILSSDKSAFKDKCPSIEKKRLLAEVLLSLLTLNILLLNSADLRSPWTHIQMLDKFVEITC